MVPLYAPRMLPAASFGDPQLEWVARVSILRPGFLLANGSPAGTPSLKSETLIA